MSQPQMVSPRSAAGAPREGAGGRALGLLLLLPAVLAWSVYQVVPVIRTLVHSVREAGFDGAGAYVGLDNYSRIPGTWFSGMLGRLLLGLLIAAVAVAVGIGVGSLVRRAPRGWQRASLAALGLALVSYAPINLTIALFWDGTQDVPGTARLLLAMLPVPLLVGALAGALTRSGRMVLVIGAVVALGGAAWAVQGESGLITAAPGDTGALIYRSTFAMFDVGLGAAASTVLGALLGALGLGAGLMLVAIRPRFDLIGDGTSSVRAAPSAAMFAAPPGQPRHSGVGPETAHGPQPGPGQQPAHGPQPGPGQQPAHGPQPGSAPFGPAGPSGYGPGLPGPGNTGRGIVAVAAAAAVLLVLVVLAQPWLQHLGDGADGIDPAEVARVTWLTAARRALEVALTLLVTGAGAFGIGYLRPFGRHSLRILLVLSPWLFIGLVPLMTGLSFHLDGGYWDPLFAGLTPQLVSVPLLFLLAYLSDGLRTARDGGQRVLRGPVLGLLLLSVGTLAVVRGQELVWDLVFRFQDTSSAIMYLTQLVNMQFGATLPLALLTPVPLLALGGVVLAGAAALVPGVRMVPAQALLRSLPVYGFPARTQLPPQQQSGHGYYPAQPGQQPPAPWQAPQG